MVKKILGALAVIFMILIAVVATRPAAFQIERSVQIAAPAGVVFALVNDFREWPKWSPWENRDPAMSREYTGADSGDGAKYHWTGNDDVGEGSMTIVQSRPSERIDIEIEFIKPFAATHAVSFSFEPIPTGTKVTWAMQGENDFMGKAFDLIVDMDAAIGGDFESGLRDMKSRAERSAQASS